MAYSNIYPKSGGRKVIPYVIGFFTNEVICKEVDNSDIESCLLKDASKKVIIERRKELSNIKCKGAGSIVLDPPQKYDVSKSNIRISSGFKFQTF